MWSFFRRKNKKETPVSLTSGQVELSLMPSDWTALRHVLRAFHFVLEEKLEGEKTPFFEVDDAALPSIPRITNALAKFVPNLPQIACEDELQSSETKVALEFHKQEIRLIWTCWSAMTYMIAHVGLGDTPEFPYGLFNLPTKADWPAFITRISEVTEKIAKQHSLRPEDEAMQSDRMEDTAMDNVKGALLLTRTLDTETNEGGTESEAPAPKSLGAASAD